MTNSGFGVSRGAMLRQVDETGLAMVDASLYLDTHPCDAAAIDYYNQMAQAYRSTADISEAQFGSLIVFVNNDAAYQPWINDPWLRERGC